MKAHRWWQYAGQDLLWFAAVRETPQFLVGKHCSVFRLPERDQAQFVGPMKKDSKVHGLWWPSCQEALNFALEGAVEAENALEWKHKCAAQDTKRIRRLLSKAISEGLP